MAPLEFEDTRYFTGPNLTDDLLNVAERSLGYRLPPSYVALLRVRNGGVPRKRRFSTSFPTSWAPDHFEIKAIRGVGGEWGIDGDGPLSSPSVVQEWGYPPIGIVICELPSGGHDTVMLDYRYSGVEPSVAYIDEDRVPRTIAPTFAQFVDRLEESARLA